MIQLMQLLQRHHWLMNNFGLTNILQVHLQSFSVMIRQTVRLLWVFICFIFLFVGLHNENCNASKFPCSVIIPLLSIWCRFSYGWNSGIPVFLDLKLRVLKMMFCLLWDGILQALNILSNSRITTLIIMEKPDWAEVHSELTMNLIKKATTPKDSPRHGKRSM